MTFLDLMPLFKSIGSFACPILYIASFANTCWVKTDTTQWGLWSWCYTNFTDEDDPEDHVNDSERCHGVAPGDSPGYYEGVRSVACFTLVAYCAFFLALDERKHLGKDKRPVALAFVAAMLAVATLAPLATHYEDDDRWKGSQPSLGWCFWLASVSAGLSCVLCAVIWKYVEMRKASSRPTALTANTPPSQTPTTAAAAAGSTSAAVSPLSASYNGRKVSVVREGLHSSRGHLDGAAAGGAEFPVLRLPRYEEPSEPWTNLPVSPPPSYEEALRGSNLPPPPYIHVPDSTTPSARNSSERF